MAVPLQTGPSVDLYVPLDGDSAPLVMGVTSDTRGMARRHTWRQEDGSTVTLVGWWDGGAVPPGLAKIWVVGMSVALLIPTGALSQEVGNLTLSVASRTAEVILALALLALILALLIG
jgi:hypothetical protein